MSIELTDEKLVGDDLNKALQGLKITSGTIEDEAIKTLYDESPSMDGEFDYMCLGERTIELPQSVMGKLGIKAMPVNQYIKEQKEQYPELTDSQIQKNWLAMHDAYLLCSEFCKTAGVGHLYKDEHSDSFFFSKEDVTRDSFSDEFTLLLMSQYLRSKGSCDIPRLYVDSVLADIISKSRFFNSQGKEDLPGISPIGFISNKYSVSKPINIYKCDNRFTQSFTTRSAEAIRSPIYESSTAYTLETNMYLVFGSNDNVDSYKFMVEAEITEDQYNFSNNLKEKLCSKIPEDNTPPALQNLPEGLGSDNGLGDSLADKPAPRTNAAATDLGTLDYNLPWEDFLVDAMSKCEDLDGNMLRTVYDSMQALKADVKTVASLEKRACRTEHITIPNKDWNRKDFETTVRFVSLSLCSSDTGEFKKFKLYASAQICAYLQLFSIFAAKKDEIDYHDRIHLIGQMQDFSDKPTGLTEIYKVPGSLLIKPDHEEAYLKDENGVVTKYEFVFDEE